MTNNQDFNRTPSQAGPVTHVCTQCGREFEGRFCPKCGTPYAETKYCPKCGTKLDGSAKFCKICGYSFISSSKNLKSRSKLYQICKIMPLALALFSLLLFIFYAAPVCKIDLKYIVESVGNAYAPMNGVSAGDVPHYSGFIAWSIVFAVLALIYSAFMIFVFINSRLREKAIGKFSLYSVLSVSSILFYTASVITSIVCFSRIGKGNKGLEFNVYKAGPLPTLLLVFSLVFLAAVAFSIIYTYMDDKKHS